MKKIESEVNDTPDTIIFLKEEERILNKTLNLREDIVDNFIKGGLPEKVGEIRVINEVLNSMDSQVLSRTDKRLKHTENENDKDVTDIIKNILLDTKISLDNVVIDEVKDRTLELELKDEDIVKGEDGIEYEELKIDDFVKNDEE